jgi:hypothetical protein
MVMLFLFGVATAMWLHAEHLASGSGPHPESVYWLALSLVSVGFGLYGLRERFRLLYGLLELAIGGAILLGALNNLTAIMGREYVPIVGGGVFHRPPEGWLQWNTSSAALLPVAAAVYIIVRGLDNVGEGFHQLRNPLWASIWRLAFPSHKKPTAKGEDIAPRTATAPSPDDAEIVRRDADIEEIVSP